MKRAANKPRVLVVDVGGSSVKCICTGRDKRIKIRSGPKMGPREMMPKLLRALKSWRYDVVTVGYPGVVRGGKITREPNNLGSGWIGFDFAAAFGCPVKLINDAAMQALGGYRGGTLLFLGLGTGLGSALIVDGVVVPMELGHLHCSSRHTYEHFLGDAGRKRIGQKKWRARVVAVVREFSLALLPDDILLGGGNVKKLDRLPPGTRRGGNADALTGGFRLWHMERESGPARQP
ncbi:MAG: ROK family protein [Pseudomonadota bacterium]